MIVRPVKGLSGDIQIQGDKSVSHRSIILGSIAKGVTTVTNYLPSDDCRATMNAFRAMGISIEDIHESSLRIEGKNLYGLTEPADVMDMGNSGTSARLLCGLLSGQNFFSVMTGDSSLRSRPMKRVAVPLRSMGANILGRRDGDLMPLAIKGGELQGIRHKLPVASAQVKSALLLAGLYARGKTSVEEIRGSRDHTERMLGCFGVNLETQGNVLAIDGGQKLTGCDIHVPGDISSAAFFMVGASIVNNSGVVIREVGLNPTRTGIIDVLRNMGALIEITDIRDSGGEPVGDVRVTSAPLKGIEISGEIIPRLVDELPVICIAAAVADGGTIIRDAAELRVKESDRISVMAECLASMGVEVETFADGMRINGKRKLKGAVCNSHGDHRIAMSMAIAGLVAEGEVVIQDTDCIKTSFPRFEEMLHLLSVR
ncbi:MAG: 3-phosphoshikimate 1-carboxyvinyltransferase [Nitrospirae bacterium]|nr:3-phosphoshikimate 1-carboxyvinyltransferase [Nitrospirota bacterium]